MRSRAHGQEAVAAAAGCWPLEAALWVTLWAALWAASKTIYSEPCSAFSDCNDVVHCVEPGTVLPHSREGNGHVGLVVQQATQVGPDGAPVGPAGVERGRAGSGQPRQVSNAQV